MIDHSKEYHVVDHLNLFVVWTLVSFSFKKSQNKVWIMEIKPKAKYVCGPVEGLINIQILLSNKKDEWILIKKSCFFRNVSIENMQNSCILAYPVFWFLRMPKAPKKSAYNISCCIDSHNQNSLKRGQNACFAASESDKDEVVKV